jgi:dissimilatory sulfite reductase (desulfoviridin) alpha/beta subunit
MRVSGCVSSAAAMNSNDNTIIGKIRTAAHSDCCQNVSDDGLVLPACTRDSASAIRIPFIPERKACNMDSVSSLQITRSNRQ